MLKRTVAFTLIELIIVVTIIGILALVAIPKYVVNIEKARKAEALASMRAIREAILGYYAVNSAYPAADSFPITVNVDGDDIMVIDEPASANFYYSYDDNTVTATHTGAGICTYTMDISTGAIGKTPELCP